MVLIRGLYKIIEGIIIKMSDLVDVQGISHFYICFLIRGLYKIMYGMIIEIRDLIDV